MADGNSDKTHLLANQPYDESVSVCDDEEVESELTPSPRIINKNSKKVTDSMNTAAASDDEFDDDFESQPQQQKKEVNKIRQSSSAKTRQAKPPQQRSVGGHVIVASDDEDDADDDEEETDEESDEEDAKEAVNSNEGAYDPAEYERLPVSMEIKDLFNYITKYTPQTIELDYKLRPFIPEYIPAVGDIDAFLKVTRPDGKPGNLGLQILDEPSAEQSDPTVLDLQLRSISKQTTAKQTIVRSIEEPEKNTKAIDTWISNIAKLHRDKPPQNVHYTKTMPDIETLMQEWPAEFEELLKTTNLPSADLDCELTEYIDIICGILDIPVYKNRVQSLHVLFSLFSEFKNSQHFNQLAKDNLLTNELKHAQPIHSQSIQQSESFN